MVDPDSLMFELARVFLRAHRLLDRRMTAEGASLARTKMLLYLIGQEGEARAADIAEFFGLAPRTVTEALDGLERDGMVRREPDPRDRRVKRLAVTEAGQAAAIATEPLRREMTEAVFRDLSEKERRRFGDILAKLGAAVRAQE